MNFYHNRNLRDENKIVDHYNKIFDFSVTTTMQDAFVQCAVLIAEGKFTQTLTKALVHATIDKWQYLGRSEYPLNVEDFMFFHGGIDIIESGLEGNITDELLRVTAIDLEDGTFCKGNGTVGIICF